MYGWQFLRDIDNFVVPQRHYKCCIFEVEFSQNDVTQAYNVSLHAYMCKRVSRNQINAIIVLNITVAQMAVALRMVYTNYFIFFHERKSWYRRGKTAFLVRAFRSSHLAVTLRYRVGERHCCCKIFATDYQNTVNMR